jgi:hypothetical protein
MCKLVEPVTAATLAALKNTPAPITVPITVESAGKNVIVRFNSPFGEPTTSVWSTAINFPP